MITAQLNQLATALAGEFDNRQQALADPVWYLHLRLWYRPLPKGLFADGYGFFIEQISVASGQPPYRQRILHLTLKDTQPWGQFYALADPSAYVGSATEPDRLTGLTRGALIDLPTCALEIQFLPTTATFQARLPGDSLCRFTVNGVTTCVRLLLDIGPESLAANSPMVLQMGDRGVDPDTGQATWGPLMGPFRLVKQRAFALPT